MSESYGVTFAIDNSKAGNFDDNIRWIAIAPKRAVRLSSMVAATISRPKSRSIRHAQGFLRAKIFRFCDFGIMRSAKSWTASWKQFGQRWSNEENPHLNHLPLRKGRGKRLSQTSRKN